MQLVIIRYAISHYFNKKAYKSDTYRLSINSIHAVWGQIDSIRQSGSGRSQNPDKDSQLQFPLHQGGHNLVLWRFRSPLRPF